VGRGGVFVFVISKWYLYAFSVIFIDTVTANRYERKKTLAFILQQINNRTFVGFMLIAVKVWKKKLSLTICFAIVTIGSS